jgi:hypothetical protein
MVVRSFPALKWIERELQARGFGPPVVATGRMGR